MELNYERLVIEIICDDEATDNNNNNSNNEEIVDVSLFEEEEEESSEEEQIVVNYDDDEYPLELQSGENYDVAYIDEDWDVTEETYSVKCDQCDREYPSVEKLRRHLRNHQERTHVCQYCGRKFLYRKDRITHERTHTGERPFACHVCDKRFVQKCTLDTHLVRHYKQVKDEVCEHCGRAYFHKKSLSLHIKEKHSTTTKRRVCGFCGKEFHAYTKYIYHVGKCREEYQNGGVPPQRKRRRYAKTGKLAHQE